MCIAGTSIHTLSVAPVKTQQHTSYHKSLHEHYIPTFLGFQFMRLIQDVYFLGLVNHLLRAIPLVNLQIPGGLLFGLTRMNMCNEHVTEICLQLSPWALGSGK